MKTIFRIDDIGASTKHYEQYGRKLFRFRGVPCFYCPLANFWFFKRIWPCKKWGKYEELTKEEWQKILDIFEKHGIVPIVAITAAWVEKNSSLTPFHKKFPEQADILKKAFKENRIVIATHGLTHCVVGKHLPKFWGSNRRYHREFWSFLPKKTHEEHIFSSQQILQDFFGKPIELFVPPGNVWSYKTEQALEQTNIKKVIANKYMMDSEQDMRGIEFVDDREGFFNFHDRELKLFGEQWLIKKILSFR